MKKCLCLLLSLTMLCLCAGAALAETVALKVWGSQEDQELLAELCEAFAAEHPETTYEFTYGVVGEADAKARYLEDPAAAADVFSYPDDQIIDLVNADALYEVTRNHDAIVAANSVGSVNAASVGGVLYGYPMTADNGYFLYYDRSVVSDEDAGSFDTLLAAAEKAGKKVQIDISNGWYLAGFFLGNGCTLTLDENGNQIHGNCKPTSELPMHTETYTIRDDIGGVVHCHPPYLTAYALANKDVDTRAYPEMMGNFCKFECAPYGRPGTDKILAGAIPILQNKRDIVLLGNHGVLVVGKTVTDAMNKTEAAEAIAKALFLTAQLGGEVPLSDEECQFFLDLQKTK